MKLTQALLREYKIFNPHNLCRAAKSKLFIDYIPADNGRFAQSSKWQVVGIGFATDTEHAWYNNGCKTFLVGSHQNKQPELEKAISWCKQAYGIGEFERDVFGCYQIKGTLDKIATMIKEAK